MAIEPIYTLQVAMELIPMPTASALYQFLSRHKDEFPGRYRRSHVNGENARNIQERVLTESEIVRIREMTIIDSTRSKYGKGNRSPVRGPLASIIRRATA